MKLTEEGAMLVRKELALILRNKKQIDQVVEHIILYCEAMTSKKRDTKHYCYRVPGKYTVSGVNQNVGIPRNFFEPLN